jgi:prevent-host-death family protein
MLRKSRFAKTDKLHRRYLEEARRLAKRDPLTDSKDGARLTVLAEVIEEYERARFKFRNPARVKPISYVKANAADLIRELKETGEPLVITENGEATAVIQDVATYDATQRTLALLKILALGKRQIGEGKVVPAAEVFRALRSRTRRR